MNDNLKIVLGVPEDIKDYTINGKETGYLISNYGYFINKRTGKRIKNTMGSRPYYKVELKNSKIGLNKSIRVNRAVAMTFIPNSDNKSQVNHIDGNKLNNNVTNLEWVSPKENMYHAKVHNLVSYGDRSHKTKYSDDTVDKVCQMLSNGDSVKDISVKLKIPTWRIRSIRNGTSRTRISNKYNLKHKTHDDYTGENNPSSIYPDSLIHKVCQLIQSGIKRKKILAMTGITANMYTRIKARKTRLDIVNNYIW